MPLNVNKKHANVNKNKYVINREDIIYFKRYNIGKIAGAIGYTKQAVSMAIAGKTTSLKLHTAIANLLGVTLIDFWPELYDNLAQLNQAGDEQEAVVNQ